MRIKNNDKILDIPAENLKQILDILHKEWLPRKAIIEFDTYVELELEKSLERLWKEITFE